MFSAFKRLTSKTNDLQTPQNVPPETAGHTMSGSLQKKFSRGVQYNMKIIIKGDRNVGKSCLLERLQGRGFIESYIPTEEIQVASIQWSFKATEDIVKVEVWDVVDRGKSRQRQTGLKLSTGGVETPNLPTEIPALDAEFLDVYKGTHGVILMMDITKQWTYEYICRELEKIPNDLPILILGNHCDMSHHRCITSEQIYGLIEQLPMGKQKNIVYGESSMRNGFGLRLLHKFLGLPFLHLQHNTLLSLIERNQKDTEICSFEVNEFLKSDDSDYNKFLDNLSNKRRQVADSNSNTSTLQSSNSFSLQNSINSPQSSSSSSSASSSNLQSQINPSDILRPTKSIIIGGGQPIVIPGQLNITNDPKFRSVQQQQQIKSPISGGGAANFNSNGSGSSQQQPSVVQTATNFVSSLLVNKTEIQNALLPEIKHQSYESKIISVEEFCPDGGFALDKTFLDDLPSVGSPRNTNNKTNYDSDSDIGGDNGNPLVASFIDEPDGADSNDDDDVDDRRVGRTVNNNQQEIIKINPLSIKLSGNSSGVTVNNTTNSINNNRKISISSDEVPLDDIIDDVIKEKNDWLINSTMRRSPEGGEDVEVINLKAEPSISQLEDPDVSIEKKEKKKKSKKEKKEKRERKERKKREREIIDSEKEVNVNEGDDYESI